jgi:ferric-dicitrate binding protein FerR (iron transport regulator)
MSEPLDLAAHYDGLSADERAALERAVAADPSLGRALTHWRVLRHEIGRELDARLPASDVLALLAVSRAYPGLLVEEERERLEIELSAGELPGVVSDVVRRLEWDARAFDHAWDAHQRLTAEVSDRRRGLRRVGGSGDLADRPPQRRAHVTPLWSRVGRLAAVFALVSLGALASYLWRRDAGLERIVAADEMTIDLPDGSSVELAAASELMIPRSARVDPEAESGAPVEDAPRFARLVAGRALFRVARAEEPFVVETPAADVTVLGTTFGLTATSGETDVVLVSGVVEVASRGDGGSVTLSPGQRTAVRAGQAPAPAAAADIDAALEWTGDLFIRSEPLAAAASRIGAAFDVRVEVDSTLATEAVTGQFDRSAGARTALEALAMAVDGRLQQEGDGYRIVSATD